MEALWETRPTVNRATLAVCNGLIRGSSRSRQSCQRSRRRTAQERMAHACGSTGLASSMHLSLLGRIAGLHLWPTSVYADICQEVMRGGALINAATSEPDLGSPSHGALPTTTARRTDSGWQINGRKRWACEAPPATISSSPMSNLTRARAFPPRIPVALPKSRHGA